MSWTREQQNERRAIVAKECERYPSQSNKLLARKLHDKHPMLFTSLEIARSAVRYHRGNNGDRDRQFAIDAGTARPNRRAGELPPLPASDARPWEPFILNASRVPILSDIHIPYQDNQALELALDYCERFNPDALLINGDLLDFYQISRFDRNPTKPKIKEEIVRGNQFFGHVRARFGPKLPIIWKFGNHDERMDLYLARCAPELFDIDEVRFAWFGPVGIHEHNITVVMDQRPVMLGKLPALHGHEKGKQLSTPVNQARGAFLKLLASVVEGHGHRTSEHNERTFDGRIICCRSTGCLCGLWPEYARVNKWDHGFATVEVDAEGNYELELKRIIDGKVR